MIGKLFDSIKDTVGNLFNKAKEIISDIFSKREFPDMPRAVERFLKKNGAEKITSLEVARAPVQAMLTKLLDFISGGKFSEGQKDANIDRFFHLYLIVNGKYRVEKNQLLKISDYDQPKEEDKMKLGTPSNTSIFDFITMPAKSNPTDFYENYNAITNNCQDFVMKILNHFSLSNPSISSFVKQPLEKLAKKLEGTATEGIAKTITDIGATVDKGIQEATGGNVALMRGGMIQSNKKNLNK